MVTFVKDIVIAVIIAGFFTVIIGIPVLVVMSIGRLIRGRK